MNLESLVEVLGNPVSEALSVDITPLLPKKDLGHRVGEYVLENQLQIKLFPVRGAASSPMLKDDRIERFFDDLDESWDQLVEILSVEEFSEKLAFFNVYLLALPEKSEVHV